MMLRHVWLFECWQSSPCMIADPLICASFWGSGSIFDGCGSISARMCQRSTPRDRRMLILIYSGNCMNSKRRCSGANPNWPRDSLFCLAIARRYRAHGVEFHIGFIFFENVLWCELRYNWQVLVQCSHHFEFAKQILRDKLPQTRQYSDFVRNLHAQRFKFVQF
jgi:hypothetical protein